ncbi:MAG: DNA repair protein RadC [Actinobacteria bacterium]|nr:DNA repair protein RadC [Actinomycetota bacterium]
MSKQLRIDETEKKGGTIYVAKVKIITVKETTDTERMTVNAPAEVASLKLVKDELLQSDREKFICLHLNTKNSVLSYEVVSIGTLSSSLVHPRELFKAAILSNSAALILCHNHPSGDSTPSAEDIALTKRLVKAGNLLGIDVLDHVIVGETSFVSLKERDTLCQFNPKIW